MQRLVLPSLAHRAPSCTSSFAPSFRRSFASASSPSGGSNRTLLYGAGALGVGGAAYFFTQPSDAKAEIKKAVPSGPPALSKDEFRALKLDRIEPYNHNTSRFVFSLPEGTSSGLTVASVLITKYMGSNGKPVIRPYTPVTPPDELDRLDLLVKKYEQGVMSKYIHDLKPGDTLEMKGPMTKFQYKENEFDTIGMIAGGSGITPMWQVMQHIDSNPSDKTKVVLIFANLTEQDILLRKEFEDLAKRKPDQFKVVFALDKPPSGWTGPSGYLTPDVLKKHLPASELTDKIRIFVCGPPPQMEAISGNKKSPSDQGDLKGMLADMGYEKQQVFKF